MNVVLITLFLAFLSSISLAKDYKILVILKTSDNVFFRQIEEGANKAKEDIEKAGNNKVNLVVRYGRNESDVSSQVNYLRLYSNRKWDCIMITPPRKDNRLFRLLKKYKRKGVKLVNLDTPIGKKLWDYRIYSDNKLGGYCEVKMLFEIAKRRGFDLKSKKLNILLLEGVPSSSSSRDRKEGFKIALKELQENEGINIEGVDEYAGYWRMDKAKTIVQNKYPSGKYDFIICANDNMAKGAVEALRSLRIEFPPPYVGGFDFIPSIKRYIENDYVQVSIAQAPDMMGYLGVYACIGKLEKGLKHSNITHTLQGNDVMIGVYAWDKEALRSGKPKACSWGGEK